MHRRFLKQLLKIALLQQLCQPKNELIKIDTVATVTIVSLFQGRQDEILHLGMRERRVPQKAQEARSVVFCNLC